MPRRHTLTRTSARILVDDVFPGGAATQQPLQHAFAGPQVIWVGVRCDSSVAEGREMARGDRALGMAASQAAAVHQGVPL